MEHSLPHELRFARKAFLVFALNSVASSLGVAAATICDALIVGNAFGETGLAITSVVMPVYMLYNFISFALGVGSSTAVSQAFGREERAAAQAIFSRTFTLTLAVGVLLGCAVLALPALTALLGGNGLGEPCRRYVAAVVAGAPIFVLAPVLSLMLRADGDPGRSTAGIILSSCVNLVLDVVFVLILQVGVEGAAWAMVIGQGCALAVYLPHFWSKTFTLRLRLARPSLSQGLGLAGDGAGTASYYAWQFLYISVFNHLLGAVSGSQGLAVFNLVFNVGMIAYAVFDGLSLAVPALAGTYLGERDWASLRYTLRLALKTALVSALALSGLLLLFSGQIVALFGVTDPATLALGVGAVRLYCPALVCTCLTCVLGACYQATGHPRLALAIQFLRGCLFLLGAGVPLLATFGSAGVAPALLAAEGLGLLATLGMAVAVRRRTGTDSLLLLPPQTEETAVYQDVLDRDFQRLPEIMEAVETFCADHDVDPAAAYSIQLTLEELASNIIRFGFGDRKGHFIAFKIALSGGDIYVRLRDDATGYDPFQPSDREDALDLMGVELVRKRAKDFLYQRRLVFNNLLIVL